jgi:hypothetical protein
VTETAAPDRRFWLLWSASTATNLGDGMRLVALPLLATSVTTDVRQIALVTVAAFAPLLLFCPFVGVLIDRTDRRTAIAVAHLTRAVVLLLGLAALIAIDRVTLGWVVLAAVLYGVGEAIAAENRVARTLVVVGRGARGRRGRCVIVRSTRDRRCLDARLLRVVIRARGIVDGNQPEDRVARMMIERQSCSRDRCCAGPDRAGLIAAKRERRQDEGGRRDRR